MISNVALAQGSKLAPPGKAQQSQATGSSPVSNKGRPSAPAGPDSPGVEPANDAAEQNCLDSWEGKTVLRVEFEGVAASRLDPLPAQLAQQPNAPLRAGNLRQSQIGRAHV